jgi:hypothetical protein
VAEHFAKLGFTKTGDISEGGTSWALELQNYVAPQLPMQVVFADDAGGVTEAA